jgi:hypothetical protein
MPFSVPMHPLLKASPLHAFLSSYASLSHGQPPYMPFSVPIHPIPWPVPIHAFLSPHTSNSHGQSPYMPCSVPIHPIPMASPLTCLSQSPYIQFSWPVPIHAFLSPHTSIHPFLKAIHRHPFLIASPHPGLLQGWCSMYSHCTQQPCTQGRLCPVLVVAIFPSPCAASSCILPSYLLPPLKYTILLFPSATLPVLLDAALLHCSTLSYPCTLAPIPVPAS